MTTASTAVPLLALGAVHLLALASPGPDFLFVTQAAISRSRGQALAAAAGVALGIAIWAALALLGLQWLLLRLGWLQRAVALAGGAYLLWLGWRLLLAARKRGAPAASSAPPPSARRTALFRAGLLTNLSNPKAVVYFTSVFAAVAGPVAGVARWGLWLLVAAESLTWFALIAVVFGLPPWRRAYLHAGRWVDGIAGVVFAGFGVHLLLSGWSR